MTETATTISATRHAYAKMAELGLTEEDMSGRIFRELEKLGASVEDLALTCFALTEGEEVDVEDGSFWMILGSSESPGEVMLTTGQFREMEMEPTGNFGPGGQFEGKKLMVPYPDLDDEEVQ